MSTQTERALVGPVCHCGQPFRRRRYWSRWDLARCPRCGAVAECIVGTRGGPGEGGGPRWIIMGAAGG